MRFTTKFKLIGAPVEMQLHLSLEAPIEVGVAQVDGGQRLQLSVQEVSRLEVESKDLSNGESTVYGTVQKLMQSKVLPDLLSRLSETSTSVEIPEVDLGEIDASLPAGTKIKLGVTRVEQREGYTVVVGRIE